jgi:hypothetical protein
MSTPENKTDIDRLQWRNIFPELTCHALFVVYETSSFMSGLQMSVGCEIMVLL